MLGFRQTSVHVFYFWFIRLHLPRRMNLFLFPSAHRAPESAHRVHRQVRENRPMARAPQTITPTAAPKIGHRARSLPHAQSKIGHPRTRSPKSSPSRTAPPQPKHPLRHPTSPAGDTDKHHKITHLRGRRKQRSSIHTANPPFHTTPPGKFCPAVPAAYFCIVIKTATKYKSKNRRQ